MMSLVREQKLSLILIILLVAILYPPRALFNFHTDDYLIKAAVSGDPPSFLANSDSPESLSDAFYFFGEKNDKTQNLKAYGALPWWTDDDALMHMFRPLSAFTHLIDHQLLKSDLYLIQLHNLLWFMLLSSATLFLLISLNINKTIVALTCLIFLIDLSHMYNFYWLAARNSYISLFFGVCTLILYHQGRSIQNRSFLVLSYLFFPLTLLSAEAGIAIGAYLLSYALFLDGKDRIKALFNLLPFAITIIVWRVYYSLNGYGSSNIGLYLDPLRSPLEFGVSLLENYLHILSTLISGSSTFLPVMNENIHHQFLIFGVLVFAASCLICFRLLKQNPTVRFFFFASLLSIIPFCALTTHTSRSVVYPYLGFAFVLASLTYQTYLERENSFLYYGKTIFLLVALLSHLALPIGYSLSVTLSQQDFGDIQESPHSLEQGLPSTSENFMVYLNYPSGVNAMFLPYRWHSENTLLPRGMIQIAPGLNSYSIKRLNDYQFELTSDLHFVLNQNASLHAKDTLPEYGFIYGLKKTQSFVSNPKRNYQVGDKIKQYPARIEILAIYEGLPSKLRLTLDKDIPKNQYAWRLWNWSELKFNDFPVSLLNQPYRVHNQLDFPGNN